MHDQFITALEKLNEAPVLIDILYSSSLSFFFFFLQRLRLDEEKAEDWCQVFFNMKLKCVKQNC